jgi:hypothetical protein
MTATVVTVKPRRNCTRCGRPLTGARSVALGCGPVCDRKVRAEAAAADAKPEQVAKALELLADGGVETLRPGRVWLVVASNGVDRYRTAPTGCTCPAGVRGRACYHQLAVGLLVA